MKKETNLAEKCNMQLTEVVEKKPVNAFFGRVELKKHELDRIGRSGILRSITLNACGHE
jgi:hypothetical protein